MTTGISNVSNAAAFGVEWTSDSATTYQLVLAHGGTTLVLGSRRPGATEWITTVVVDPQRFGLTTPPKSFAKFKDIALRFINGAE